MKAILLALALLPIAAFADDDYTLIGLGVRTRPEFDGSNNRVVDVVPYLRYYGKTLFARTTLSCCSFTVVPGTTSCFAVANVVCSALSAVNHHTPASTVLPAAIAVTAATP